MTAGLQLPPDVRNLVERAAASAGQTVEQFAASTLAAGALDVLRHRSATELSDRDRDLFLRLIDDPDAAPNDALQQAVARHGRRI